MIVKTSIEQTKSSKFVASCIRTTITRLEEAANSYIPTTGDNKTVEGMMVRQLTGLRRRLGWYLEKFDSRTDFERYVSAPVNSG